MSVVECREDEVAVSESSGFGGLALSDNFMAALERVGYTSPTPIQSQTIPLLLAGRDVVGQAQTGTGKTAAFAIPMLQKLDAGQRQTQVLVLAPTRELAIQVAKAFERYSSGMKGLRVAAIYGGQDYQVQFRQLDRGAQVVVGTPGRVMDHMRRGSLQLDGLRGLVLDEADEMLKMGFAEDVEWILTQTPTTRQTALFSATMPEPIRRIAQQHLQDPVEITIKQRTATADTIRQRFLVAGSHQKEAALSRILEAEPIDGVLIFVKTKNTTSPLAEYLVSEGHRAAALNGDMPQAQRERIVDHLRRGKLDIVVATDVAARGLDVQRISHVINYDLPGDSEAYVHRIGRTGRAGRSGEAILMVHPRERRHLKRLEQATRNKIEPMELPTNRQINKQRVARFHEKITAGMSHPEMEKLVSIIEQYRRDNDVPWEHIAAALAAMALGDKPLLLTEELKLTGFTEGRGRDARDPRGDRGPRSDVRGGSGERRRGSGGRTEKGMATYRIEVGHVHHVKPGNIVGAIANETGLESAFIGRIDIFDDFSTVDLPEGMPQDVFHSLKRVWVSGRPLRISRVGEAASPAARRPSTEKRPKGKSKHPKSSSTLESPACLDDDLSPVGDR
jgi:ATP-dependent RNA helicase DeaD